MALSILAAAEVARPANAITSNAHFITTTQDLTVYESSYQNFGFYAQFRYWVFYEDTAVNCEGQGGCLFYTSSVDGASWATPTKLAIHVTDSDWSIVSDGNYAYYARYNETSFDTYCNRALLFGRGLLSPGGSIGWDPEQVVRSPTPLSRFPNEIIQIDSSGQVWIGYQEDDARPGPSSPGCVGGNGLQTPHIVHADNALAPAPLSTSFISNATNASFNQTIAFTANATGGVKPYVYGWNFGDGTTGNGATPSHSYLTAGTYTVTLTTNDNSNPSQVAVVSQKIAIGLPFSTNQTPKLRVPVSFSTQVGRAVTFSVNAFDLDGDTVTLTPTGLPPGTTFLQSGTTNVTETFSWTPTADESNKTWVISFNATDSNVVAPLFATNQVLINVSPLWSGDRNLQGSTSASISANWHVDITTLPLGDIYAAYWANGSNLFGRIYHSGTWAGEEQISGVPPDPAFETTDVNSFIFSSASNVYAIWYDTSSEMLRFATRSPGGSWGPDNIGRGESTLNRYSMPFTASFDQADSQFYVFWYNATNRAIDEWSNSLSQPGIWIKTTAAFSTASAQGEYTISSFHQSSLVGGNQTLGVLWVDRSSAPYNLNFGLVTRPSTSPPATDASWNPKVTCPAAVVTVDQILGNQISPTGGATEGGSLFNPGIQATSPGDAKRWLTPGPTPSGWIPNGPPCTITNADGQIVSAFVEIRGVEHGFLTQEDPSSRYDFVNGGTVYPNGLRFNDTTFNIFPPSYLEPSGVSCSSATDPGCMHTIHVEFDHDWKAAGYCGPNTICDNIALKSDAAANSVLIDVQGFVYWDPDHANDTSHAFSGWEIHPLTAWRLSGQPSIFGLAASPKVVQILPGKSGASNITINAFNVWQGFPLTLTPTISPAGPTVAMTPTTINVPPCNHCGVAFSTLSVITAPSDHGNYTVKVTGGSGPGARSVNVTALVAGFAISASPPTLSIPANSSSNSTITLTSLGGFNGQVTLSTSVTGCACGFVTKVTPSSVTLTAGGNQTATLTVTAGSQTGNAAINVTGTSSTVPSFSASRIITVAGTDFNITASNPSLTMNRAVAGSTTIILGSLNGFSGTVSLAAPSNSTNLISTLSTSAVTLQSSGTGSTASILLTVNGTRAGNYVVTVTATSGLVIHQITVTVKVVDFSLASVTSIQVNVGSTATATINLASLNGFSGIVSLTNSTSSLALHDTLSTQTVPLTSGGTGFSTLTMYSLAVGNYTLTITATSGSLQYAVLIKVNVVDFSIVAGPVTPSAINIGSLGNSTVTLTAINGFNRTVTMSLSAPAGLTCSLSLNKVSLSTSPTTSILSCRSSIANDYVVTVTGTNGTLSHTTASLLFHAVDFSITSLPSSSITLVVGQSSGSTSIHVGSVNGFTGTVALNVLVSPVGPSAFLSPPSLRIIPSGCACNATVLNIIAGQVAGVYTLNVTATNGLLTHWTIVTLTVTRDSPSITSTLSSTSIFAGGSVTDSAKLTGATSTASGTVTYFWFANGGCTASPTIVSIVIVSSNVIPNSRSIVFNATGSYSFNATYSGDNNNSPASSPCEPLAVQKDITTITTSLSLTSIPVGQSVSDSATLASFFQAGGTVSYNLFKGSATCVGTSSTVSNVTVSNGIVPNSRSVIFNSTNPGGYSFRAIYSGDANNNGATSGCEPLTVNPVGASITTTLSAATVPVGGTASDNSTLHGQTSTAGGTVTYNDFANGNCAAPGTIVSIVNVSNGAIPNSRTVAFNSSGTFSFNAVYSGDSNNNGATSGCEPLTVNKAAPVITTIINPSTTIIIGGSVTDQATLTGGFPAIGVTGTVTYTLFSFASLPSATTPCSSGTLVGSAQTVNVGIGDTVPSTGALTPPTPGFYGFSAVYNGNGNNTAATGNCEPLTVNKQTLTLATVISPSSSVVAGTAVTDQATITGGYPSTGVGGTVTYRFFGLGNAVCGGTPTSVLTVTIGAQNSVPPSGSQTLNSPGQYSFNATYNGDANNYQVTSSCELLTVSLISTTTGVVCGSSVTVGVPTSCTVTVLDAAPGTLTPTGTVNLTTNSTGTFAPPSPCNLSGSTSSSSCAFTYTPGALGVHNITATYPGDSNHKGSAGSAILSPGKHSTSVSVSCSSPIVANQVSTCTATVSDTSAVGASTPTGSVTFTETGVAGSFNVTSCSLTGTGSAASCGVRFIPSASGTASIVGSYGGDGTHSISSNTSTPAQVTVNPSLVVNTPSATPSAIDTGQSANLFAAFTGGTSPYTCQWLQESPGSSTFSNFGVSTACTSSASVSTGSLSTVGTWSFELKVTDSSSSPVIVVSAPATVTVNPALSSPTIFVAPPALDLGQSATLTTTTPITGGTSPYTCQWLAKAPGAPSYGNLGVPFACIAGDKPTAPTGTLSTVGSWSFELKVTDNGSPAETVTSVAVFATLNSPLTAATISAAPSVINSGQSAALSTITSFAGGTSTYSCQWLQKAPAVTTYSNLGASFVCNLGDKPAAPTSALSITGIWSFELQVSDSGSPSETVTSSAVTVTVNGPLSSGAISPNSPTIDAGQSITLTANPTGGTSPYTYLWYSDGTCGTPIASATASTFNPSPSSTSTYSVRVTDSASSSACSTGDTVTVNPALVAGTVTPSTPAIDAGQSLTLGASPSGGTVPYHYQWYSGASASCSSDTTLLGTAATQVVSPAVNTYYCYNITDSAFAPATQSSATDLITVDSALAAGPIMPLSPTIDSGQSITLTANPSGGAVPYSYQWYAAASCTTASLIPGATTSTYVASPASTTNFFYKVTDSSQGSPPASQCSPGDFVTVNPALAAGAITPPNPTIDSGQLIMLSSHASGGTPSLSYQWYSDGACTTIISGATLSTYSASPTSASTFSYKVTDSANSPTFQCSIADAVTVNPALVVGTITPASPSINSGQPITLTANPSGGTVLYNYQWYSDGVCNTLIASATSQTYSTSPILTTTYSYKVTDSSFSPIARCSPGDTVTVNSAIVAGAITPPNPTIDSGQSIQLTSHVSGGTSPFSYLWYSDGVCGALISGAIQSTFTASPPTTASYSYKVTDSAQSPASACSPTNTLTVNPALTAAPITPSSPTIDAGQSITLSSHVSGGTASISYQWFSDGSCGLAISGATSPTYVTTPSVITTYTYQVKDSANLPAVQCSLADVVTVDNALVASAITPSNPAIDTGQSITLTANPSGGTTPYAYQWYSAANCASGSLIVGATSSAYAASPTSTTTYYYRVTDSSQGSPVTSSCSSGDTVTVGGVLSAGGITPNAPTIDSGQTTTLNANPSGGSAPYSFQWYSDSICTTAIPSSTSSSYNASPSATSTYSYKVTDFASATQCSPGDTVTVNPSLVAGAITPTSPTIDSGQSISLSAAPSAGTPPYGYQWFAATGCVNGNQVSGATSSTIVASPSSTTTYSYRLIDSSIGNPLASACSPGDLVTVSLTLVAGAITPSSPTIDNGQSILLTSAPSGGTTNYSYQWFTGGACASAVTGATSSTYNASPASSTTYSYRVTDSAFLPISRCSSGNTVTVNSALVASAIAPASPKINSGQSITLTANPSGGTTPYTYQWYFGTSVSCSLDTTLLGTTPTQVVSPTANAYYCYTLTDSAFTHASQSSITDLVTVDPVLMAGPITPTNPTIDNGQSITLTANQSGGTGPYSYQWYSGTSTSCLSDTAPLGTLSTQLVSSSSTAYYCYRVTDNSAGIPPASASSSTDLVTVNSALTISPLTTTSPIDSGQPTSVIASWSGGTIPYIVTLYTSTSSSSCTGLVQVGQNTGVMGTTSSFSQSLTATTNYCGSVADGASSPVTLQTTSPNTVVVNPALSVSSPTATSSAFDSGQQSTLSATFAGGTSPYACQWLQKAPGATAYGSLAASSACTSPTSTSTAALTTVGSWSFELQVTDTGSPSVIVTSNPLVITVNPAITTPAITASPATIGAGQNSMLSTTTSFTGGTASYTCQWLKKGPLDGSFGNFGSSFACNVGDKPMVSTGPLLTSGIWSFELQVSDSGTPSQVVNSSAATITVNGALSAGAIAPGAPSIDAGQSITLSANAFGGVPSYAYQWYSDSTCATIVSAATSSTYLATPTATSTYSYKVTDSAAASRCSPGDTVTVNSALVAGAITPSAPTIDVGQSVTLVSNPSGGTALYSYQWYSDSSCTTAINGATSSTFSASPGLPTTYAYRLGDAAQGTPANLQCSAGDTITVNLLLVAGPISPSNPTIDNGQSIILTSHTSGGTSPISYQWYSDGTCLTAITGATSATYTASPTSTTTYSYKATDSAFSPASQCSIGNAVTVAPTLAAGTITPGTPLIDNGQSITLVAHPSGGTTPYIYQWHSGTIATCASDVVLLGNAATQMVSPTANTFYCYTVTDASSSTQSSSTDLVSVNPILVAGAVTPPSAAIDNGQSITLTANPSGGTGPYHYQWYSSANTACPGTPLTATVTLIQSPSASTYYCYTVTDSSTGSPTVSVTSAAFLVSVNPALAAGPITPPSPSIDNGQSITLTANPSGGTTSYQYQWFSGSSASCSSDNTLLGTAPSQSVSPITSTYYCYRVTDSSVGSPTASVASVTDLAAVSPTLTAGSIAPASPTIDNGQSVSLTAKASGGVGAYSYQWYSDGACTTSIPSATSSTYAAPPVSTTTYSYKVTDSANSPASICSSSNTVTVNPALVAGPITPSNPTIDSGQLITFTSHASWGTPALSYQWYSDGTCGASIIGANLSTFAASPTVTGVYSYKVTDSAFSPASQCSAGDPVTVVTGLLAGAIAPASPKIDAAQSIALTANPSGGATPYSYQWYADGTCNTVILSAVSSTYNASPTATATYSYKVTDSSNSPASLCSAGDTVTVNPSLVSGIPSPPSPTVDTGQSILLVSHASGGMPPLSYQWYSDGSCTALIPSATLSTYTASPVAIASYSYKVTDSAYSPSVACSSGDTITVNSVLVAGAITPSSPTIDSGQPITLTTHATGGTPQLSYQWYSDAICSAVIPGATSATYSVLLLSTTTFSYRVTDISQGSPAGSSCSSADTVTMSPALVAGPITPSSPTINNGQSITLISAASGGTTPYSYQWYSAAGCLSGSLISPATSSTLLDSPAITTTYSYRVTDTAYSPISRCSSGDTVKVNPTLAARAITPTNPAIDTGQQLVLTSQASGGTQPFAYQWYSDASCTATIAGATLQTLLASPTTTTAYSYKVTDFASASECSPGDTVTVNTQLASGSVAPAFPAIDNGQSITLTANPFGGTTLYHYLWYSSTSPACLAGAPLGTSATILATPTMNTYYCYAVTDSAIGTPPAIATSGVDLVGVNPALTVGTPSSSSSAVDPAQSSTLSATISGGVIPYTCQWLEKAPGSGSYSNLGSSSLCSSSTSTSTGSLVTVGVWSFELQITDGANSPVMITSSPAAVVVNHAFSPPTISASPITQDLGLSSTLTTTTSFSGGTSPYICQWLQKAPGAAAYNNIGNPFPCSMGDQPTVSTGIPSTSGSWSFELKVSDSASPSQGVTSTTALTVREASPTITVALSSGSVTVGDSVTASTTLTGSYQAGGSVTYEYFAGSVCSGIPATVGAPVSVTSGIVPSSVLQKFNSAGSFAWEGIYSGDSNNLGAKSTCEPLTVNSPPSLSIPGAQTVTAGTTVRFVVNATDGSKTVTLTASGLPPGATFSSTQSFAGGASSVFFWTPSDSQAPGDYSVTFTAQDSQGVSTVSQVTIHVSTLNKAAPLPILSYSIFGVLGFLAVLGVALLLRRLQSPRKK